MIPILRLALCLGLGIASAYGGYSALKLGGYPGRNGTTISRRDTPVRFWIGMVGLFAASAVFLLTAFLAIANY
jgi:hypothetical protein